VARTYAGILGLLGFLTSLARGFLHGQTAESMLLAGWCSLAVFAAVGYVAGAIAGRTVEESVAASLRTELAQDQADEATPAPPPSSPSQHA
jgi:outer membrane lipoprotein SlyB